MSPVCLSATLVDQDHIGLEILETNCTDNKPNTFALRSSKAIHLFPGKHGEIWRRLDVGWEKVACWSTKAAISLKRVKIEEKLLWMAYGNSPTLFQTVPSPTLYVLLFPKIGCSQPPVKTAIAIISGTGKAMNFKLCMRIHRIDRNKSPLKISGKVGVGVLRDCRNFSGHPYIGRIARSPLR